MVDNMSSSETAKPASESRALLEVGGVAAFYATLEVWSVLPPRIISAVAFTLIALLAYFRVQKVSLRLMVRLSMLFLGAVAFARWIVLPTRWEFVRSPALVGVVEWGPLLNFQMPIVLSGAAVSGAIVAACMWPHTMPRGRRWTLDEFWDWSLTNPRRLVGGIYITLAFLMLLVLLWDSSWAWIDLATSRVG